MIKKIEILGVRLDNYTVREAIRQVEGYLSDSALNTIERVSVQMLIESESDPVVRDVISSLDLAVIGEKEIMQAARIHTMQRLKETEEDDFSFEFFKRVERNKKSLFLLGETEEEIRHMEGELLEAFPKLVIVGGYAVENSIGDPEAVINEMNAMIPDVVVSVLPTPLQEHFFSEHRSKMNAALWYGIGNLGLHRPRHGVRGFFRSLMDRGKLKNSMSRYVDSVEEVSSETEHEEVQ